MTKISILGSGRVATVLAAGLVGAGHELTLGVRDIADASAKWKGPPVAFDDHPLAVRASPIVVNATPGDTSLERLGALRQELDGKILIDVSNATERGPGGMPGGLLYPNSSLAERLQDALPHTRVVKTLNTMLFTVMVDPDSLADHPTAFLSGDDAGAKQVVTAILRDLGWADERIEDLGDIVSARGTEALFALVPYILRSRGMKPFALALAR